MLQDPAWKKALLAKGAEVAAQLSALLDHKEVDLASLPAPRSPDDDPELRLRRFLALLDRAIKSFGTDAFGRCQVCGAQLSAAALRERPWLAHCPAHPEV
jgi:RNA polymerase-binding transcription factor DksA